MIVCMEEDMKKIMKEIFIDGLSGMASGLFATLIIGTIIVQIGNLIPGAVGQYLTTLFDFSLSISVLDQLLMLLLLILL